MALPEGRPALDYRLMPATGVREVRRGAVSVRVIYAEHAVQLACSRHDAGLFIPLDAAAFGRELMTFFQTHEDCSAGETGVVVDVTVAIRRVPVD